MSDDKTTFGATIVSKENNLPEIRTDLAPAEDPPSRTSTPPSCIRTPQARPQGSPRQDLSPGDLESGLAGALSQTTTAANSSTARVNRVDDGRLKECTAWPTKQSLKQKALLAKNKRQFCPWWSAMNKRQKIIFKVLIALFVVGVAVAVGVGISIAVGGGVWSADGESSSIPS